MADATADGVEENTGKSRKGLVLGLVLALVGGGGAFSVTSGMLSLGGDSPVLMTEKDFAFVPLEQMTIPLMVSGEQRFLRFRGQLEVAAEKQAHVESMLPRVVDVLNTYLRSLSLADVEDPTALLALRAQMRRRIDLVVGGDAVHDLLVMEFLVN